MSTTSRDPDAAPDAPAVHRRRVPSVRRRILGWYMATLAIALIGGLFIQRGVLRAQIDRDVEAELVQEVEELRSLAEGLDPSTGEPFAGDVAAIFDTFLARNIPSQGEALLTLVNGRPYKSTVAPVQLLENTDLVADWAGITESSWGETTTEAGRVRYVATPLRVDGRTAGVFIVAMFMELREGGVDQAMRIGFIVFGSVFLVASLVAWLAAGRVLRPIRQVTAAAHAISETNWRERIAVDGDEEVAELARTFNTMLDRLEEAFATQRQFIDDAGHELRTPITIIRGHLDVWSNRPDESAEARRVIDDELDRMARMVDELLLLAKAEHGDFLQVSPLDAADLTEEMASKAHALAERPWSVGEVARVVVTADRQRITQAVMNLARNAVEHTPAGTPIELGSTADGDVVRFWVRDHGQGIDPSETGRVFERFSRGRAGGRSTAGAGLGLAIVRVIAEAHGGRVELDSTPGEGATFAVVLPLSTNGAST